MTSAGLFGRTGMTIPFNCSETILTSSPEETVSLGVKLSKNLRGGEIITLSGELGSGKTTFIRGLAKGLGVEDSDSVKSPSYTLVIRYPGPLPLLHLDAYFMHSAEDLDLCGMEEALLQQEVVVIEWGERILHLLPEDTICITLEHITESSRKITVSGSNKIEKK